MSEVYATATSTQSKRSDLTLSLVPKRPYAKWRMGLVVAEQALRQKEASVVDKMVKKAFVEPKLKDEECC